MVSFEFLAIILTGLGLTASIMYYSTVLRNANKTRELQLQAQEHATETRQVQLLMHIYQEMSSESYMRRYIDVMNMEWENYDDYERKYGSDDHPEQFAKRLSVWRSFQGVGLLLKDGLVDADRLYDLIGSAVLLQWVKWEPIFKETRVRYGMPDDYLLFENLYHELIKVRRSRGITVDPPDTGIKYVPSG
jgi:hypothetical protein